MSFKEIKGHDLQIDFLVKSFLNGRLKQAYLFVGKEGIGKALVAKNFVKFLICENKMNNDCCESCSSCLRINSRNHPDVLFINSDNQEAIKIEQTRELKHYFTLSPYEANYKVAVIEQAGRLTIEAQNSLLKILEEPSKNSIIILIAKAKQNLLPTIVSRCQILNFNSLPYQTLFSILCAEYNFNEKEARITANYANGSLGAALNFRETNFLSLRDKITATFFSRDKENLKKQLYGITDDMEFKMALFIMLTLFRDSFILKAFCSQKDMINNDYFDQIQKFYRDINLKDALSLSNKILELYDLVDKNINKRLIIENIVERIS